MARASSSGHLGGVAETGSLGEIPEGHVGALVVEEAIPQADPTWGYRRHQAVDYRLVAQDEIAQQ